MMPSHSVDEIAHQSRNRLVEAWEAHFRCPAPKGVSTKLLARAVAYQEQANAYGGLKPSTKKALLNSLKQEGSSVKSARKLQPGTRLVREWNGRKHVVDVADRGFVWKGSMYKSLSAIAREITGTRWSGPRFFGL